MMNSAIKNMGLKIIKKKNKRDIMKKENFSNAFIKTAKLVQENQISH